jgi:uncharacterized protein YwqG
VEDALRNQIRARLPRVASDIEGFLRYAIGIRTAKGDERDMPIGSSKIGGQPDLPNDFGWPDWNGKHLGFIAQVNLKDVAELNVDPALPKSGVLSFFYEADEQPWGFDPTHKGSARVLYFSAENLTRRPFPEILSKYAKFDVCRVHFQEQVTLPPAGSAEVESLELTRGPDRYEWVEIESSGVYRIKEIPPEESEESTPTEWDIYGEIFDGLSEESGGVCHRMLGYPDPIQGDMQLEVQLASHGIYAGSPDDYQTEEAKKLEAGAKDWRLLLQIDSDENAGTQWGDVGRIYYWIRQQDLEARNFDKVWLILQCY